MEKLEMVRTISENVNGLLGIGVPVGEINVALSINRIAKNLNDLAAALLAEAKAEAEEKATAEEPGKTTEE